MQEDGCDKGAHQSYRNTQWSVAKQTFPLYCVLQNVLFVTKLSEATAVVPDAQASEQWDNNKIED